MFKPGRETVKGQGYDLKPVVEGLKNLGLAAGGIGSLAVLFYWIGNAIIIERLRIYKLYGIVHYTDEYVTEAGYQFLRDFFTFFGNPIFLIAFILIMVLVPVLIPVGPYTHVKNDKALRFILKLSRWVHYYRLNYLIFLLLAIIADMVLISEFPIKRLPQEIQSREKLLIELYESAKNEPLAFSLRNGQPQGGLFYDSIIATEEPTEEWTTDVLNSIYPDDDDASLRNRVMRFQKDFGVEESPDLYLNAADFRKSTTYQKLLNVRINEKLIRRLQDTIRSALDEFKFSISGKLSGEGDTTTLSLIPANYELTSSSLKKVMELRKNMESLFEPLDGKSEEFIKKLSMVKPVFSGNLITFFLLYSFWILIALLIYLFLNIPRIIRSEQRFEHWELGYFFIMLLLFITVAVTLPTAYGRYKFDLKIQRVNGIGLSEFGDKTLKAKMDKLFETSRLYILGPTRGKEVIVGAVERVSGERGPGASPQILIIDRETYKYIIVEPVSTEDMDYIIAMFRPRRP